MTAPTRPPPRTSISIVVPVYSGEKYLGELVAAIDAVRAGLADGVVGIEELILVDDAAVDGSPALVDALAAAHPWIVALHMSRNYGQHAATVAGILHTAGDWVVTMDEDLQHRPELIMGLLTHAVRTSADVVYARPLATVHGGFWRDASSRGFKRLASSLTGDPNLPSYNSFRLIRGSVARSAASVVGHDTYFDVSLSWFTLRVASLQMAMRDNRHVKEGASGYSFRKLLDHAGRLLFSSHLRILRWSMLLGLGVVSLALVGAIALVVLHFVSPPGTLASGWTSLAVLVTFFGGLIVFMLGIILQYLSSLMLKAHGKPNYFLVDRNKDTLLHLALQTDA